MEQRQVDLMVRELVADAVVELVAQLVMERGSGTPRLIPAEVLARSLSRLAQSLSVAAAEAAVLATVVNPPGVSGAVGREQHGGVDPSAEEARSQS